MTDLTHTITISIHGRYPHGEAQHASVTVSGDGGIEHFLDTFRAALVAAGFAAVTAEMLDLVDGRNDQHKGPPACAAVE